MRNAGDSKRARDCTSRRRSSVSSCRRSAAIRLRTIRRSTSSWLSPCPNRLPIPPRVCSLARWVHMPRNRGSRYCSCANWTCRRPSRVFACRPKISRMSAVRSMIFTGSPTACSRFDCCEGVSSSSKITTSIESRRTMPTSSSTFPEPMKVRGTGRSRRCVKRATTSAPAVCANRSSSSSERSTGQGDEARSIPRSSARSGTGAVSM